MARDTSMAPTAKDEELTLEFGQIEQDTHLRVASDASVSCASCHFSNADENGISYCWNEKLGMMVAGEWLCDMWAEAGSLEVQPTEAQQAIAEKKHLRLVEGNNWRTEPQDGQQCSACLYYNSPEKAISYCWNPSLQVEVGQDHWCTNFQQGAVS